ncbi:hydantoinase/oxoprolinase family protein, partial [bacterium]|nr:hydantoinase/oxoprolinase family protein [bacterium]
KFNLNAPLNILKADGGTIAFTTSRTNPVQTILSGPAASVMGIIALSSISEDAIILDIGGTTTDIAIFAAGAPLLEKDGASFASRATSIRAIKTCSIGIGGDSLIAINKEGEITVGPQRQGPPMALAGDAPTLIDACNIVGLSTLGDREKSFAGFAHLAEKSPLEAEQLAQRALEIALKTIHDQSSQLLDEINQKPAYTVAEIIHGEKIVPQKLFVMGGPALVLAPELEKSFNLETVVPENFAIANAVGAALTKPTMEAELFADTGKKRMFIPSLDFKKEIDSSYSLAEAKEDGILALTEYLKKNHFSSDETPEIEVVTAEEFNMVDDYAIGSKSIRVCCQLKPGLENNYLLHQG